MQWTNLYVPAQFVRYNEQQELELVLEDVEPSEAADLRRKRRREVGKGWKCDKYGK
jgi:hypothetical protein